MGSPKYCPSAPGPDPSWNSQTHCDPRVNTLTPHGSKSWFTSWNRLCLVEMFGNTRPFEGRHILETWTHEFCTSRSEDALGRKSIGEVWWQFSRPWLGRSLGSAAAAAAANQLMAYWLTTNLHEILRLVYRQREKRLLDSPWTSFWAIFWVRMSDDRRRTSPLNTHSCTGKSSPVRTMGFLLLSSIISVVVVVVVADSVLLLSFTCDCCCWVDDGDLISLWLLKILLARLLFALGTANVPVAASSSGSSKSSSCLGRWSFRKERIFSPVIF